MNIQKSKFLVSRNIFKIKKDKFTSIIDFSHSMNLGRFLGFPLLSGRVRKSDFSFITDSMNSRLAG